MYKQAKLIDKTCVSNNQSINTLSCA